MITNERQYKITKKQKMRLINAISKFDLNFTTQKIGSEILAKAELEGLKSQADELDKELKKYELLKTGAIKKVRLTNLADFPRILIQSRIAQNLTQQDLANRVNLKEQQIQKYESEEYASANIGRLQMIADALNIRVKEVANINPGIKSSIPIHTERARIRINKNTSNNLLRGRRKQTPK